MLKLQKFLLNQSPVEWSLDKLRRWLNTENLELWTYDPGAEETFDNFDELVGDEVRLEEENLSRCDAPSSRSL